jgi:hypothetical protein
MYPDGSGVAEILDVVAPWRGAADDLGHPVEAIGITQHLAAAGTTRQAA